MKEKMTNFLLQALENSSQSVFFYKKNERIPFFANKQACKIFADLDGNIDLYQVFDISEISPSVRSSVTELLKNNDSAMLYDVKIVTNQGETVVCDVQVAYADEEKESLFVELYLKANNRMEMALSQVNLSSRPAGILLLDENLTILHGNKHFYDVFSADEISCSQQYKNSFAYSFSSDMRESLLRDINVTLNETEYFSRKVLINTLDNKEIWHAVELHRRTLDNSGIDKVMVCLTNIQDQVKLEEEADTSARYFEAAQELTDELLFIINIQEKSLIRRSIQNNLYDLQPVMRNFPNSIIESGIIHPEDEILYRQFAQIAIAGEAGRLELRLKRPNSTNYEMNCLIWTPIKSKDGVIREVYGKVANINEVKELQKVSQYFSILQSMSQGMLYRFDIENRILYRNEDTAEFYKVASKEENYPDPEKLKQVFHPDDIDGYVNYVNFLLKGEDGTHMARLLSPSGKHEYHKITFKSVKNPDGTVSEMIGSAVNVHKVQELKSEYSKINQYFNAMQKLTPDILYHLDMKSKTFHHSDEKALEYGTPSTIPDFVNTMVSQKRIHPDDVDDFYKFTDQLLSEESTEYTLRFALTSDIFEWYHVKSHYIHDENGKPVEIFGKMENIQKQRDLEQRATHDPMTKVLNKVSYEEAVTESLKNATDGVKKALLFIDLDDFKGINDTLGHGFGDFLLITVTKRLKRIIREVDLIGRIGGDEFSIFLQSVGDDGSILERARLMLETLNREFGFEGKTASIKASVGIATYPNHGETYKMLFEKSDLALYASKEKGKNMATIYSPDFDGGL